MFKQEDGNKWDGRMPRVTGGAIPFIDIKSLEEKPQPSNPSTRPVIPG